ncbi:hypothetical protein [Caulobacter sp. 1776]|uniref:hypothetical protein n=1 Tax=Caulobacter sp. 1776 TaxID=3156420 RepID=UPI0033945FF4
MSGEGDNSKAQVAGAANHLVDRLQDEVGEYISPASTPQEQRDAVEQMIGDLEASPEVRTIREAGGEDPGKFGSAGNPEGKALRRDYDQAERDVAAEQALEADRERKTGEADFSKEAPDRVTGPLLGDVESS